MILKYIKLGWSKEIQFSKQTGLLFPTTGNKLQQKNRITYPQKVNHKECSEKNNTNNTKQEKRAWLTLAHA